MSRQREIRRVSWDGPHPQAGDYLAARHGDFWWLIRAVSVHRGIGSADGDLTLTLVRHDGVPLPRSVFHSSARCLPSAAAGPPRVRQVHGSGPTAVMKATWRDPTDTLPNASRRPRQLSGYRTFCPLRRIAASPGSQVTELHIVAADEFRAAVDLARIGRAGGIDSGPLGQGFFPSAGPSARCIDQAAAAQTVKRCLSRIPPAALPMLSGIVLENRSMSAWCALVAKSSGRPPNAHFEMGRLLTILDLLVWVLDVEAGLDSGRLAGVA